MTDQLTNQELVLKIKELEEEVLRKDELIQQLKNKNEDIDIKRLEKELQKTKEKALNTDKLKSAFLSNMSHTIRTPMNAIIGFSELIAIENISPKRKDEYIKIINAKGHQLLGFIDDIIEISKIESGRFSLNITSVNPDEFLNEIFSQTFQRKIKAGKDQVELILHKQSISDELLLQTDPGRLQQILNNLLLLAIQNTSKGSIEFGYSIKENKIIEFFIKDTGVGYSKEEQKYLFDYFWHFDEVSNQHLTSIGLGLTVSKQIIELLGGKINVISEPNKGTTITFSLSLEKPGKTKTEKKDEIQGLNSDQEVLEPNWKNKVLLVVEDDEVNYQFIEALLEKTQVQLLHANDGHQALELCKSICKIDLILMDLKLPEKSGFQVTKEIKQIRADIPIIAHTAFAVSEIREKCFEAGCIDVITKPMEIPVFFAKVNKYLANN
jgi:signal transduction histidine kinase/CheY-like chemotaxis protein